MRARRLAAAAGIGLLFAGSAAAPPARSEAPTELVLDVRIFETRSSSPSFELFQNLSFFIDTDGAGVSEVQWLATIARQVPEAFVAVLASDALTVVDGRAELHYELRSRGLELDFDLSELLPKGTFPARLRGAFTQGESERASFERAIELRVGQTYVFSGPNLELAPSDYLSHFREYDDGDHRSRLYEYLRDDVFFLLVAVTPRMTSAPKPVVDVSLPKGVELPEIQSPVGIELSGTLVLEFDVDDAGVPGPPVVHRSTVPELTPRLLLELADWRFPEAAGRRARLTLKPRAER